jgi:hypothetical protein
MMYSRVVSNRNHIYLVRPKVPSQSVSQIRRLRKSTNEKNKLDEVQSVQKWYMWHYLSFLFNYDAQVALDDPVDDLIEEWFEFLLGKRYPALVDP